MFSVNRFISLLTLLALLVVQVKAVYHAKAKKVVKGPSEKDQLKEMSERLDIISQATDHFKFFRDCFVNYEDPSDISTLGRQLEEARKYLPRSLVNLEERIKNCVKTPKSLKRASKLLALSVKLRLRIYAVIKLTSDDFKRIELGMKKYMDEKMSRNGFRSPEHFAKEASEISNTLSKLKLLAIHFFEIDQ